MNFNIFTQKLILVLIILFSSFYSCFSKTNSFLADELILKISSACAETGSNVCFDVTVEDFNEIASVQFTVNWDPSVLDFDRVETTQENLMMVNSETNFGTTQIEQGRLLFSWTVPMDPFNLTLDNGALIYQICYDVVGEAGEQTDVFINGDPVIIEVTNSSLESIGLIANHGAFETKANPNSIIINEQVSDLVLSCEDEVPEPMIFTATTGCAISQEVDIAFNETQINLCENSFYLERIWSFTNACGDEKIIERRIDFKDDQAPEMANVPEDITITIPSDTNLSEPNLDQISVVDNCSDPVLTYVDSLILLGDNIYQVTRRFYAEDGCNNLTLNEQLITVFVGDVWPGDTDNSFAVDQVDLFNIGFGFGETGAKRNDASINWIGQYADIWDNNAPDGTNYKHADTNGDGVINDDDIEAVNTNWAMTHNFQETESNSRMEFSLELEIKDINEDGNLSLDLIFGDSNLPLSDFYGLAFTINFDQSKIDPQSFKINYENNWIGNYLEDYLQIQKIINGKCETAIVKKDHVGAAGFGKIGSVTCQLKEEFITQASDVSFSITQAEGVNLNGSNFTTTLTEEIVEFEPTSNNEIISNQILLYPNPTMDFVFIKNANRVGVRSVSIYNSLGNEILHSKVSDNKINLSHQPNGVYIVLLDTSDGKIWKRIIKSSIK